MKREGSRSGPGGQLGYSTNLARALHPSTDHHATLSPWRDGAEMAGTVTRCLALSLGVGLPKKDMPWATTTLLRPGAPREHSALG